MEVTVNGESRILEHPVSITEFLLRHNLKPQMVVVERNRVVVSRDQYANTILEHGDELEIVQMMAGG